MDGQLALLDAHVAEAAEAWLTDPRDAGVYARLVAAVEARRRHLDRAGLRFRDEHVDLGHGSANIQRRGYDSVGAGAGRLCRAGAGEGDRLTPVAEAPGTAGADEERLRSSGGAPRAAGPDQEETLGVHGDGPVTAEADEPEPLSSRVEAFGTTGTDGEDRLERIWPAVRSVGSDLAGDPAAVLRRLRGG